MSLSDFENMFLVRHAKHWYLRFERQISSLSLVGGFIFDIFALDRVDEPLENLWVGLHLVAAAGGILFIHLFEENKATEKTTSEDTRRLVRFWSLFGLQFAFGGLLSVFLVFYFRSGSILVSWPFFVLLAGAFIANESLKDHYSRLLFQISMFFISTYAFAIYMTPVLLHRIGDDVFLISGAVSVLSLIFFLWLLRLVAREHVAAKRLHLGGIIIGILIAINGLYFLNLIPPLPLSLQDSGVFHSVTKQGGNYVVTEEKKNWESYFRLYEPVHILAGGSLYVWSAVFSPEDLDTGIVHTWQYYNETTKKWVSAGFIPLSVVGGRSGGFRTYSVKSNISPGKWLVSVTNQTGQVIGRVRFDVEVSTTEPALVTVIK